MFGLNNLSDLFLIIGTHEILKEKKIIFYGCITLMKSFGGLIVLEHAFIQKEAEKMLEPMFGEHYENENQQ